MQCGYYDERMWLSFLKWTSQKCSGPYAQTAQQVSSNTVYGILFPSSLNGTVSGAIGESEQSFKPFRLQIRYSKLQFIARSHSKITPFRWSVAFYSRAEGHSHSQTYRRLQSHENHSSREAIILAEGGWTKLYKMYCGRYRLEMLCKRSSSSALKNTCCCHMVRSLFRKQHDYTDSRCSHILNKTLFILPPFKEL